MPLATRFTVEAQGESILEVLENIFNISIHCIITVLTVGLPVICNVVIKKAYDHVNWKCLIYLLDWVFAER